MNFYLIKNILILILVYAFSLFRGFAKVKNNRINRKILVMPASKLGDLVCSTPIFRAIKDHDSKIETIVCASSFYEKLFEGNTDIDHYYKWDENLFLKNIISLRKLNVDTAIVTTPSFTASACLFLAGIKTVIVPKVENGFSPYQTKSYKLILPLLTTVAHHMGNYAPREYLRLLEPLGIKSENTKKNLVYSSLDMGSVEKKIFHLNQNKKLKVGISPGVGNSIKQWDPSNFSRVAEYILNKYDVQIYVIGTKSDNESVQKMMGPLKKYTNVCDVSGEFDISEIKAFISKLNLLIAVDTGVIYIAEAFNVPTIDIIGSMDENEQPPRGKIHKLVFLPDRKPEIHIMNSRCYDKIEARKHIENITPEMVFPYVDELLK